MTVSKERMCVWGEGGEGMWVGGDVTCLPLQGLASVSEIGGWGRERSWRKLWEVSV